MIEEIFEEYLRELGIYIIDGKKYYALKELQYLSQGHYRLPNGEFTDTRKIMLKVCI